MYWLTVNPWEGGTITPILLSIEIVSPLQQSTSDKVNVKDLVLVVPMPILKIPLITRLLSHFTHVIFGTV